MARLPELPGALEVAATPPAAPTRLATPMREPDARAKGDHDVSGAGSRVVEIEDRRVSAAAAFHGHGEILGSVPGRADVAVAAFPTGGQHQFAVAAGCHGEVGEGVGRGVGVTDNAGRWR